ncbi:SGNH/GDSL hydrolase family protein [Roseiterribacter gracilis]|uniref:SGNH hydrolase-type esterase domain-containing protein n=1 Tax=Roseiterribacter gracilis TaxID=2812848 RepID=A0A8S8XHW8_9PROT|nr:hypothetical protein TMPK1_34040 [Rhodospirillales bacterium TMPK1]
MKHLAAILVGCLLSFAAAAEEHWVGSWASAPMRATGDSLPPADLNGATVRQSVRLSLGGTKFRLRLSNLVGTTPLTIAAAQLGDRDVTFGGETQVTIPAGALLVSDPIAMTVPALRDVAITLRLGEVPKEITAHPGSRTVTYVQPAGTTQEWPIERWYFINGIDVVAPASAAAVVAFGDSITDGYGLRPWQPSRWPDFLARRLQANKTTQQVGVLNLGIGGNRLLRDGLGPNALARFDRDVLAQSGARWVILFEAINDFRTRETAHEHGEQPASLAALRGAYLQMARRAQARGMRIYAATILPYGGAQYFTVANDRDRQALNDWIRSSGVFDAVIDLDAALRDPADPSRLAPQFDSGDHLHPNVDGYRRIGDAIDLRLFALGPR